MSPGFRPGLFVRGNLSLAFAVYNLLSVELPEGDAGKARQAAEVWAGLADDIREWGQYGDSAALAIVMNNAGESVNAFGDFWRRYFPPPPVTGDVDKLIAHCEGMSEACRSFAEIVDYARQAYWALLVSTLASFFFLSMFPWMGALAYRIAVNKIKAMVVRKFVEDTIAKKIVGTLAAHLAEYSIGSAFFAVGDVAVMDAGKLLVGEDWHDVVSLSDNWDETWKEWVASVAFYPVFYASATPMARPRKPLEVKLPEGALPPGVKPPAAQPRVNPDVNYFISRMAGGNLAYGPVYHYLNGDRGKKLLPTEKDIILRTLLYTTMAAKPAG